jgi:hypothetical protein
MSEAESTAVRDASREVVRLVQDEGLSLPLAIATACAEHGVEDHEAVIHTLKARVEAENELLRRLGA